MIDQQRYESIQSLIISIIDDADVSIDPVELLEDLRGKGISRELGSTIMWEMIGAGHISKSKDWHLSPKQKVEAYV